MDKHHDHHQGSGFFNGFLLGAIIGAAVVFFLFTEKGKKLLGTIMEEGSESFHELRDILDEEMEEEDEVYDDVVEEAPDMHHIPQKKEVSHIEPLPKHEPMPSNEHTVHVSHGPKRFFKRGKRA